VIINVCNNKSMQSKSVSHKKYIDNHPTLQEQPYSKRGKRSPGRTNSSSNKCASYPENILKDAKRFQTDLEHLRNRHKTQLKDKNELLKVLESLARNVQSEIEKLHPITQHHLQQLEKRSLRRDLVMLFLAIAAIVIELLFHFSQ